MRVSLIEVNQPIGTFYISALPASVVIQIAEVKQRQYDSEKLFTFGGIQRKDSMPRILEIAKYCADPDATFPTPIIIAVKDSEDIVLTGNTLEFDQSKVLGEIIDGQHRIKGIKQSNNIEKFDLPVIFMFDLTEEEKAYVFSIINSKQTKVPMSLIYDLFALSTGRSPQKTCHEIARLLNSDEGSPFYRRLKMLGKKQTALASLSQGSFIKYLLLTLTNKPEQDMRDIKNNVKLKDDSSLPFRYYFINEKDEIIYKILSNLFGAVSEVFKEEWDNPEIYILSKTTGYGAILRAFPQLYAVASQEKDLSKDFFKGQFEKFKKYLLGHEIELKSDFFPSNEHVQRKLAELIVESVSSK